MVLGKSGDDTTSIESAIAKSGVSVQEVSVVFGGTRELILAMVARLSDAMCASLSFGPTNLDLQERLLQFGQRAAGIYATSVWRALYRIGVTESIRHTGLGREFHEAGAGRLHRRLTEFLRTAQVEGALGPADPDLLASHFLSPFGAVLDAGGSNSHELQISPVGIGGYVRNLVDVFCHGIGGGRQPC